MRKIIALVAAAFFGVSARAQYIVYDPAMHTQQILNQAQDIAKYVQMVDNQVQQINVLTAQLQAFGNPATLLNITGVNQLVGDLDKTVAGQSLGAVQGISQGVDAMTFNANGLYHTIGTTFQTPSGNQIQREEDIYRKNAAIQRATLNYTNVVGDVNQRRATLRTAIAATTTKLQSATTASEVQKLTGVLIGLDADLADTDKEVDQAATLTLVQDAENRDDQDKQSKARLEEQQTEFSEAITNYGTAFQPASEPPNFPTQ